jgi:pyruvate/2-oxoglutarate/acetoin dehydrogenase E1 component
MGASSGQSTAVIGSATREFAEATIVGEAIGMAMRGLRPMAEIQYLDYFLYALQIVADDLANLRWRTHGGQKGPRDHSHARSSS